MPRTFPRLLPLTPSRRTSTRRRREARPGLEACETRALLSGSASRSATRRRRSATPTTSIRSPSITDRSRAMAAARPSRSWSLRDPNFLNSTDPISPPATWPSSTRPSDCPTRRASPSTTSTARRPTCRARTPGAGNLNGNLRDGGGARHRVGARDGPRGEHRRDRGELQRHHNDDIFNAVAIRRRPAGRLGRLDELGGSRLRANPTTIPLRQQCRGLRGLGGRRGHLHLPRLLAIRARRGRHRSPAQPHRGLWRRERRCLQRRGHRYPEPGEARPGRRDGRREPGGPRLLQRRGRHAVAHHPGDQPRRAPMGGPPRRHRPGPRPGRVAAARERCKRCPSSTACRASTSTRTSRVPMSTAIRGRKCTAWAPRWRISSWTGCSRSL